MLQSILVDGTAGLAYWSAHLPGDVQTRVLPCRPKVVPRCCVGALAIASVHLGDHARVLFSLLDTVDSSKISSELPTTSNEPSTIPTKPVPERMSSHLPRTIPHEECWHSWSRNLPPHCSLLSSNPLKIPYPHRSSIPFDYFATFHPPNKRKAILGVLQANEKQQASL